jgi:hypothetical protein
MVEIAAAHKETEDAFDKLYGRTPGWREQTKADDRWSHDDSTDDFTT